MSTSQTNPPPYCDYNANSKVELVVNSHIIFNGMIVQFPTLGNDIIFLALSPDGTKFAGIGHNDGLCWEWINEWFNRGPVVGPNGVIYNAANELVIVNATGTPTGSQGWRYIDDSGDLVMAWTTYADKVNDIYQYITHNGIIVGQGGSGGLVAIINNHKVMIKPGNIQNIHFYKSGNDLYISGIQDALYTLFYHLTVAALNSLPPVVVVTPPVVIPPNPAPLPVPIPQPPTIPESPKPVPVPLFFSLVELKLMNPEIVSLVCFDHYARVLNGTIVFDQTVESAETDWEISKPDDRFAIKKDGKFLGMDSTSYGTDICKQFYLTDNRGNYESFFIGKRPSGLIEAVVEYITQGVNNTVPFASAVITIKRKV
jgi:hypothetical protein